MRVKKSMFGLLVDDFKIEYRQYVLRKVLLISLLCLVLGVLIVMADFENITFLIYMFFMTGLFYLLVYIYRKIKGYMRVINGVLEIHFFPFSRKKLVLDETTQIIKKVDQYILKTSNQTIVINTTIIKIKSLKILNKIVEEIERKLESNNSF